jgi:hypothetical protein
MIVLLHSPSGSFEAALDSLPLVSGRDSVILVSAVDGDATVDRDAVVLGSGALPPRGRLMSALEKSAIGRNLKRILPWDGGRRFATRARRDPAFRAAVAKADLIVALERDAVLAAWSGLRRWAPSQAQGVFGVAPARALLTSRASQTAGR